MLKQSSFLFLLLLTQVFPAISAETGRESTRWQSEIDAFLAADEAHSTEPGGVVCVGSSSIRLWDLAKSFPKMDLLNRGFGGSEILDSTYYFADLVGKHRPRLVLFYAGDNDIANGNTAEQAHADFREFVAKLKEELPDSRLAFISIKPSIARWNLADTMKSANALIAADCEADDNLTFVDVWPVMLSENGQPRPELFLEDGLHVNEKGYALWAELLKPILNE